MSERVTLIIPGLLDPVPYLDELPLQELPALTAFSTILSRGQWTIPKSLNSSDNALYDCVFSELALISSIAAASDKSKKHRQQQPAPIAPVTFLFDREQYAANETLPLSDAKLNGKWIMRADPCFMTADRDQLVMARTGDMDLSLSEAKQLVDSINEFFTAYAEEHFWKLYALTPQRWYIVSDKTIDIQTTPPEKVLGQSLKPFLLSGADSQHWLNLFNEWQMILHQSPINQQRQAEKKLPVNSVWFWGAGQTNELLSETKPSSDLERQYTLYSDNIYATGLARLCKQMTLDLPSDYLSDSGNSSSDSKKAISSSHSIYVIEDLMRAVYSKDVFSWVGMLEQFEKNFLQILIKEIRSGNIEQLEFVSPSGKRLLLNRRLLRRWWRKKQAFYTFLTKTQA